MQYHGQKVGSCKASVEEELGRLFRSPVFNTFNIHKVKKKEKNIAEAQEPLEQSEEKAQEKAQDALDTLIKEKAQQSLQQKSEKRRSSKQKSEPASNLVDYPTK